MLRASGSFATSSATPPSWRSARKDHAWFVAALRDFAKVWVNMSPDNQGRFLRALIDKGGGRRRDKGHVPRGADRLCGAAGNEGGSVSDRQTSDEGTEKKRRATTG